MQRVQFEQSGHPDRCDDPLYRVGRVLLGGEERLEEIATEPARGRAQPESG